MRIPDDKGNAMPRGFACGATPLARTFHAKGAGEGGRAVKWRKCPPMKAVGNVVPAETVTRA